MIDHPKEQLSLTLRIVICLHVSLISVPGGRILDAACGTGKYWPLLLERGFAVQGTDQSQQMLQRARDKFSAVLIEHIGLQELTFFDAFDAVIFMDAMENIFPEYWPVVLGNFTQALHKGAYLYFTVEVETDEELQVAYDVGQRLGLPLVYGEYTHHGGYHYYPSDEQVRIWLEETHFTLLEMTEGDEYRHYLVRSAT